MKNRNNCFKSKKSNTACPEAEIDNHECHNVISVAFYCRIYYFAVLVFTNFRQLKDPVKITRPRSIVMNSCIC